nr:MAG TPA: hypothetical protein [Caudoviricetes sp.]
MTQNSEGVAPPGSRCWRTCCPFLFSACPMCFWQGFLQKRCENHIFCNYKY